MDQLTKVFIQFLNKVQPVLNARCDYKLLKRESSLLDDLCKGLIPDFLLLDIHITHEKHSYLKRLDVEILSLENVCDMLLNNSIELIVKRNDVDSDTPSRITEAINETDVMNLKEILIKTTK